MIGPERVPSATFDQSIPSGSGTSNRHFQETYHAIDDDSDIEPHLPHFVVASSHAHSNVLPPLDLQTQRSYSPGGKIRKNEFSSDLTNGFIGVEEGLNGPRRLVPEGRKFTNRAVQECYSEDGSKSSHGSDIVVTDPNLPPENASDVHRLLGQTPNDIRSISLPVNPSSSPPRLTKDHLVLHTRRMGPSSPIGTNARSPAPELHHHADHNSSHPSLGPLASASLRTSCPPPATSQILPHDSLGNRISTFFGSHRPSSRKSSKRPSTSQSLMGGSGIGKGKNNGTEKRTLFSLLSSDRYLHPSALGANQSMLEPSGFEDGATREIKRFQSSPQQQVSISRHKVDSSTRPSTSIINATNTLPAFNSFSNRRALNDFGENPPRIVADTFLQTVEASPFTSYSVENSGTRSLSEDGISFRQEEPLHHRMQSSTTCGPNPSIDVLPSGHTKSFTLPSARAEDVAAASISAWALWGAPSIVAGGMYPDTKQHRLERFDWEVNPSVLDGREMMGFGGDLGKKRMYAAEAPSLSASSLLPGSSEKETRQERLPIPYILGYEKHVLAFEPLIQDAFFSIAGDTLTFYPEDMPPPKRVLDIGTGTGAWPIAMAQKWQDTTFVGLDIAPIQTDLHALATAERMFSHELDEEAQGITSLFWQDIASRVTWQIGDFLQDLPFDTGSFDMVHIRFVGLGVPETSWNDVVSEAARVLKRETGIIEIVEISNILPSATPHSLKASFASLMLSSFIHQYPFIPIRPALAMSALTVDEVFNVVIRRSEIGFCDPPNVLLQAMGAWVDSALGKGKHGRGKGMSGNAYGVFSKAPVGAVKTPKWGDGVMGEQALKQLRSQADVDRRPSEDTQSSGFPAYKQGGPTVGRRHSRLTSESNNPAEDDEVNLVVWLARRKA